MLLFSSGVLLSQEQPVDENNDSSTQAAAKKAVKAALQSSTDDSSVPSKASEKKESKTSKPEPFEELYLNFENTELSNFINYMAELKKINLIPDNTMAGNKVSLTVRDPLSVDQAWNVFLTVLEMAGFSIIKVGDMYKIVPKDKKLTQPLPAYINVPYTTLPESDLVVRYVYFLNNLQAESVVDLVTSMLSDTNSIIPQNEVNALIITDKSYNIRSAIKVLQELDQAGDPETVVVIRLQRANAVDVKELLKTLIQEPEGGALARLLGKRSEQTTKYFPPGTKIIAEERSNSLILIGARRPIEKIEKFITEHVDTQLKASESPLHVYELQYADATQIAEILRAVTQPPEGGPGQQAARYGAIRGGVKYFKSMNILPQKDGNRLIISSTDKEDWKLLKKTIEDLDKPQPQVAIEALFVSVDATNLKQLGGVTREKKANTIGAGIDFQSVGFDQVPPILGPPNPVDCSAPENPISLLGNLMGQLVSQQGATLLSIGKGCNIWSVFEAVKRQTNATLLAQPFLTVANKKKGILDIGREERVVQETSGSDQGFEAVQASKKVIVTPQINLDGVIRMSIEIDIQEFTDPTIGNRSTRHLETNITVADGQVLILGGFVETKVEDITNKTPILGDIPILGWMFKNHKRTITRQYIFIFLSSTIIKPRQTPGMQLYTKMKLHRATDEIEDAVITAKTRDPIFNWYFNQEKENYSHKVIDFANARYQPTTVDIKNDPYYRSQVQEEYSEEQEEEQSIQELLTRTIAGRGQEESKEVGPELKTKTLYVTYDTTELEKTPSVKREIVLPSKPPATSFLAQSGSMVKEKKKTSSHEKVILSEKDENQVLPLPVETLVEPGSLQARLQEKRTRLKNMLAQRRNKLQERVTVDDKRSKLKQFFSETKNKPQEPTLNVNSEKRKSLKRFFTAQQSLTDRAKKLSQAAKGMA